MDKLILSACFRTGKYKGLSAAALAAAIQEPTTGEHQVKVMRFS